MGLLRRNRKSPASATTPETSIPTRAAPATSSCRSMAGLATPASLSTTCSAGSPTIVLPLRRVVGVNPLPNTLKSLTAGNTDFLRVTMSVPAAADNTFQGKNSSIKFSFDATFRQAGAK